MLKLGFLTEDGWNATAITVVNNTVDELTAPLVDFSAKSDEVIESKKLSGMEFYSNKSAKCLFFGLRGHDCILHEISGTVFTNWFSMLFGVETF